MGHKIDASVLTDDLQIEHQLARAVGGGQDKELVVCFILVLGTKPGVCFVVRDHRTEVFRSKDLERAVEAYNAH